MRRESLLFRVGKRKTDAPRFAILSSEPDSERGQFSPGVCNPHQSSRLERGNPMAVKLSLIYYSATGTTYLLARGVEEGAKAAGGEGRFCKGGGRPPEQAVN